MSREALMARVIYAEEAINQMAREPGRGPPGPPGRAGLPGRDFDPIASGTLFRVGGALHRAVSRESHAYVLEVLK